MKNLVIVVFFGFIVFVANLFRTENKMVTQTQAKPVNSQQLVIKENQRRVLINELQILVSKNSDTIDSLKQNR